MGAAVGDSWDDTQIPINSTMGILSGKSPTPENAKLAGDLAYDFLVPHGPADVALMAAPLLRVPVKAALAGYGALEAMQPVEAEAGPVNKLVEALRRVLPMDVASRMARARKMGLNPDETLYRGQPRIDTQTEFTPDYIGGKHHSVGAAWFSNDPHIAAEYVPSRQYAGFDEGSGMIPAFGPKKQLDITLEGMGPQGHKELKKVYRSIGKDWGFDNFDDFVNVVTGGRMWEYGNSLRFQNAVLRELSHWPAVRLTDNTFGRMNDSVVVFDGKNIRSPFAKFDPAQKESSDILASAAPIAAAAGALAAPGEAEAGPVDKLVGALRRITNPLHGWHGSPHDFPAERLVRMPSGELQTIKGRPDVLPDVPEGATVVHDFPLGRFDLGKMGSGEGAQAYGHGAYLGERRGVAQDYRDKLSDLSPAQVNPAQLETHHPEDLADLINKTMAEFPSARVQEIAYVVGDRYKGVVPSNLEQVIREAKEVQKPLGRLYEVNIHARPEEFLDWDKPLRVQPRAAEAYRIATGAAEYGYPLNESALKLTGQEALTALQQRALVERFSGGMPPKGYRADASASELLNSAGIPGIRYLDQGSRAAGDGTHNYVMFDPARTVEILRKFGLLPAAGLGAAAMQPGEAQADIAPQMIGRALKAMPADELSPEMMEELRRIYAAGTFSMAP